MKKLFLLLTLAAVVLAGCGSGNEPTAATKEESTEAAPATTTKAESAATTTEADSPETTTEQETPEPAKERTLEEYFAGVWEGTDAYSTTIVFNEDHTILYRELNSKLIATVEGYEGTWEADSEEEFFLAIPGLGGDGYQLKGTLVGNEEYMLECTNGKPWNEEIIKRGIKPADIVEKLAQAKVQRMLPDGEYSIDIIMGAPASMQDGKIVYTLDGSETVFYLDAIETGMELIRFDGGKSEKIVPEKEKFIPVSASCVVPLGSANDAPTTDYATFFNDNKDYVENDGNAMAPLPLVFTIKNGEIVYISWVS